MTRSSDTNPSTTAPRCWSALLVAVLFVPQLIFVSGCKTSGETDERQRPFDTEGRRALAMSIVNDLAGAREKPYLAAFDTSRKEMTDASQPLWIAYHHEHGRIGSKPNPSYEPGKKSNPTLPVYAEDGVAFSLYFYEGAWEGTAAVHPRTVAGMNVVLLADGPKSEELRELFWRIFDAHSASIGAS